MTETHRNIERHLESVAGHLEQAARQYESKAMAIRSVIEDLRAGRIGLNGVAAAVGAAGAPRPANPRIRSVNKVDSVRRAIARLGDSFTPSEVMSQLDVEIPRARVTTILHRLATSRKELIVEKTGVGGVEPRYRKGQTKRITLGGDKAQ